MPPAVEENFDSVYAFLEAGGRPQGRERVACDATCQYLVGRTFPPPTSPPGPSANPSELKRVGSLQGTRLRQFYSDNLPGAASTFHGCNIAAEAAATLLPEEARAWWRWHDGILVESNPRVTEISPRRPHLPLRYVAEQYAALGGAMLQLYGIDGLLNPVGDKPYVYFHCAVPRDAPVPIYTQHDDVVDPRLVLPSIGELVLAWIDLMDRDVWRTNPDGTWAWDHTRLTAPDVLDMGIY